MNLEQASNIGDLVASVTVIISLIYLAQQIKQNTDEMKLNAARNATKDLSEFLMLPAGSEDFADIFVRGFNDFANLKSLEQVRFFAFMHKYFRTAEATLFQFNRGALDPDLFDGHSHQFFSLTSLQGARHYWNERRSWYSKAFQEYVDLGLKSSEPGFYKMIGTQTGQL